MVESTSPAGTAPADAAGATRTAFFAMVGAGVVLCGLAGIAASIAAGDGGLDGIAPALVAGVPMLALGNGVMGLALGLRTALANRVLLVVPAVLIGALLFVGGFLLVQPEDRDDEPLNVFGAAVLYGTVAAFLGFALASVVLKRRRAR